MAAEFSDIQKFVAPLAAEARAGAFRQEKQVASDIAARGAAQAERARQTKLSELKDLGYGTPQRKVNEVGGYTFYDTKGNPISAAEFAGMTGKSVGDSLQGSLDPGDVKFLQQYNTFKAAAADPTTAQKEVDYLGSVVNAYNSAGTNIGNLVQVLGMKRVDDPTDAKSLATYLGTEKLAGIKPEDFANMSQQQQEATLNGIFSFAKSTYDEVGHYLNTPVKDVFEEFVKNHGNIFGMGTPQNTLNQAM